VTWGEFARSAPDLAECGSRLLGVGVAYIGTSARDRGPRVHPFTPLITNGRMLALLGKHTVKYHTYAAIRGVQSMHNWAKATKNS
jgi:hypothetical protein